MKYFITLLLLNFIILCCQAQWEGTDPIYSNSGSVGIGTSTPLGLLHLKTPGNGYYWSSYNYGASLVIDGGHHNSIAFLDAQSANPMAISNYDGRLLISKMPALGNVIDNPSQLVAITPAGRLGIRTVNPQSMLDVRNPESGEGQVVTIANFTFGGQNHFYSGEGKLTFGSEAFSNGIQRRAEIGFTASGWNGGGTLRLYTTPNDETYTPKVRMVINQDGNVGIGTTSPDQKLTVKGVIHTEEVNVDLNVPAPDYVFERDYELRDLGTLKAYININKHLPEVPSAKELAEQGLNLKEMNLILLKKVEELTLYVIAQKEEIEAVKEENRKQRIEIEQLKSK